MQVVPKFRNSAPGLNHAPFRGHLVSCEMGLANVYLCTEFKVSSFIRSKFTEAGLKFKNSTLKPDHALFKVLCHS